MSAKVPFKIEGSVVEKLVEGVKVLKDFVVGWSVEDETGRSQH